MRMMRLRGKIIGIVGFGRIRQAVPVKARVFGLNIIAEGPAVVGGMVDAMGGWLVDLATLLAESDFVTRHAPLAEATRNLMGAAEMAAMKREAFLINAARGPLIDEGVLYDALSGGMIAGADGMVDN